MASETQPQTSSEPSATHASPIRFSTGCLRRIARLRRYLTGPVLIGLAAALTAIALSLFGMLTNPNATPLNLRSFVLVVVIAGGSWGLIAWAIATAAVEAGRDEGEAP